MDDKAKELIKRMESESGFARLWRKQLAECAPTFMGIYHN